MKSPHLPMAAWEYAVTHGLPETKSPDSPHASSLWVRHLDKVTGDPGLRGMEGELDIATVLAIKTCPLDRLPLLAAGQENPLHLLIIQHRLTKETAP